MCGKIIANAMGAFSVVAGTLIAGIHVFHQKNISARFKQESIIENYRQFSEKLSTL